MSTEVRILSERIRTLMDAEHDAAQPLAEIERTMTDGYAQAHLLEAERRRLERRIGQLAAAEGDANAKADELSALSSRSARTAHELTRLRTLLAALRRHHAALRAA
ncbi:MAG: hypothetical protein M3R70_07940 [Actinomycetota bacterium]|nr:hypothetical protein [Actinomycetota bacterium]